MPTFSKDLILFSTADWDHPFWTNKQHMAVHLARRGYRVLYIDTIGLRRLTVQSRDLKRLLSRLMKGLKGLRLVQENIWVYSPLVIPVHHRPYLDRFNHLILATQIRRFVKQLRFRRPIFWTYNPLTLNLIGQFGESIVVYHCVDDLTASPRMPTQILADSEKVLVRKADLVFTSSPHLQDTRAQWNPQNTFYFPNVADYKHFSKAREPGGIPSDLESIPKPRIGFIGAISEYKLDLELIECIARKKPEWQWVLIGQVGEGQPATSVRLLERSNIHLLGPRPYAVLPDYLRGFDVAILPNINNNYTRAMFPMKFFEYLAAGKPVVATNLPALQDYADACRITDSPEAFLQAVADILDKQGPNHEKGLELAKAHTWQARLEQMESLLNRKFNEKF